jgi:glycosyltransferase involved in cell wall biosynthesis
MENHSTLSIVIPCYNESATLEKCVNAVLKLQSNLLGIDIHIVDDASTDNSFAIAQKLSILHPVIKVHKHQINQGKGAALRTGFQHATGDFVAVQDADLEYDPNDLKRLLIPLIENKADVVLGSRFLSSETHRVLYFWHSVGNTFLTLLSNMMTDLNLTDMETCYKVFRREIIQSITIEENRFGFEPEIVAKIAQQKVRIYEMGISYFGRTYDEGKKINWKDGVRALYCILRYNFHVAPAPIQFLMYLFIGGTAAVFNLGMFLLFRSFDIPLLISVPAAFVSAAFLNYFLCIRVLFRHKARWNAFTEILIFSAVVLGIGSIDVLATSTLVNYHIPEVEAKVIASGLGLFLNFTGRRSIVFRRKTKKGLKVTSFSIL